MERLSQQADAPGTESKSGTIALAGLEKEAPTSNMKRQETC
jgi:hypothetical protein